MAKRKKELQVFTYPQHDDAFQQRLRRHKDFYVYYCDPFIMEDLMRSFIGWKVSSGTYRTVYNFSMPGTDDVSKSDWVIKVAPNNNEVNLLEWQIWSDVKDTPHAKWFAPCLMVSPSGHFLVQRKCTPIKQADIKKLPKQLPQFFTDIKIENWGFIGKQLVCFDYQMIIRAIDFSMNAKRKADWWSIVQ